MPVKEKSSEKLRAVKKSVGDIFRVHGDSGTERYGGYITEEPNYKWRDEERVKLVEEMRRSDASVRAVLSAIKAPIKATSWKVEGPDEKVNKFVEDNLFKMKNRTWKGFISEALTFADFGFSVFEIVYEVRDGYIQIRDLAPRIQHSILKWKTESEEPGVTQLVRTDEGFPGKKDTQLFIPMSKLLVFTNEKEGDDLTGQSILRAAYKHYFYKDTLYRIQGIAAERYGVGVPTVTLPDNYGEEEKDKAEEMVSELRSNEKSYIILPAGFTLEIKTPNGNPQGAAMDQAITHHDKMILMSVLATFLGLGVDSTGSFALSKDQSSFFLKHVEDLASYMAEQITEQVIRRLIEYNFADGTEVPKLTFTALGDIDFSEYSTVIKTLTDGGFIATDPKTQQFVRKFFKLPEMSDEERVELELDNELAQMEADIEGDTLGFDEEESEDESKPAEEEAPEEEKDKEETK